MSSTIDGLTLTFSPNSEPTWSGTIKTSLMDTDTKILQVDVPLSTVGGIEYVRLDLWIDKLRILNEQETSVSGVPYVVRPLVKHRNPCVISSCTAILEEFVADAEESDSETTYDEIIGETFGDVLSELFYGSGWKVIIDSSMIRSFPVVTEANPVVTFNGSLLEQFTSLLGILTPPNLWGQSLSFFVNIFSLEIIVVPPEGGSIATTTLDIEDVAPLNLEVRKEEIELPSSIIIQEQDTALFRSDEHKEEGGYKESDYEYETQVVVQEEDMGVTNIRAYVSGDRTSIGNLVLTDNSRVIIDQTERALVGYVWGVPVDPSAFEILQTWSTNKTSDITVETEYEYLLGPPYDVENVKDVGQNTYNGCFGQSLPGTRQQISRDHGSVKITKTKYPSSLLTTDGIRVLKKIVRTTEASSSSTSETVTGNFYDFPSAEVGDNITVTDIIETFAYDEDGNLVTDRTETTVTEPSGKVTITERTRIIAPVSDELSAETIYTLTTNYDFEGAVQTSSVTDVSINIIAGEQTGPSPASAYTAAEEDNLLKEKELVSNDSVSVKKLNADGSYSFVSEDTDGVIYVGIDNLTLQEIEDYLNTHYALTPEKVYYVSFESDFVDVRYALGGKLQFTGGSGINRDDVLNESFGNVGVYDSGLIQAMATTPFRVSGISMQWESEKQSPTIALAFCQLV